MTVKTHNNTKGLVRAFDVKTGKLLWTFNTIPKPGRVRQRHVGERVVGDQRQHRRLDADHGRRGSSASSTCRSKIPTSDFYGGHRPGNNLFGESLVCVDLKTGQRKWHFQIVHHPIWDYDMSSAPILLDINVDGKPIKAVALPSKEVVPLRVRSHHRSAGVADRREAGAAVRRAGREDVADAAVPDQAAGLRAAVGRRRRSDRLHAGAATPQALEIVQRYKLGPMFLPPRRQQGRRADRGADDRDDRAAAPTGPAPAADPETHIVYAQASNHSVAPIGLVEPPAGFSDIRYVAGTAGQPFVEREGPGFGSAADAPQRGRGGAPGAAAAAAAAARRGAAPRPARSGRRRPRRRPPAAGGGGGGLVGAGSAARQAAVRRC